MSSKIDTMSETDIKVAIISEIVYRGGEQFEWLDDNDRKVIKDALYGNSQKPGREWLEKIVAVIDSKITKTAVRDFCATL